MSATWRPHGFRSQKEPRLAGTGSLRSFPSFPAYFSTGRRGGGLPSNLPTQRRKAAA